MASKINEDDIEPLERLIGSMDERIDEGHVEKEWVKDNEPRCRGLMRVGRWIDFVEEINIFCNFDEWHLPDFPSFMS